MTNSIDLMNKKISNISNLIIELESEFKKEKPEPKRESIRFPRSVIKKARSYKDYFPFIVDDTLNANIAYTLQLTDVYKWILNWFDIGLTAKQMLIKHGIALFTIVIEALAFDFVKHYSSHKEHSRFSKNLKKLLKAKIINQEAFNDFDKCRCMRDDIHLHRLDLPEREKYDMKAYNFALHCIIKMKEIFSQYYISNF